MADAQARAAQPAGAAAEASLAEAAREAFGGRLRSAWLSGSYVYGGARPGQSDIDVVLVLEGVPLPADPDLQARIRRFVDSYLEAHARAGLDPDLDFPGEYVVAEAIGEAVAWRGIATEGRVARELPPPDAEDYWIGRPDRWFNAWLSMTAFTRFLAGDRAFHEARKLDAWTTIVRFLLLRSGPDGLAEEQFWDNLEQFGVKPRYCALEAMEGEWLARAIAAVEAEGGARRSDGRIEPDLDRLRDWERRVGSAIAAGGEGPLLLPPPLHAELGRYAASRWPAFAPADA
jgi:predicted nucleotidyltransferase